MFIERHLLILISRANKIFYTADKVVFQLTVNEQLNFVNPL